MSRCETGFFGSMPFVHTGTGRPIVLLSGGDAFVRRFDERSAARDIRRMTKLFPPGSSLWVLSYDVSLSDLSALVAELAAIIRTQFGRATVAGISFGGLLALRLAAEHPDVVRELILIASAHRFSPEGRACIQRQIADVSNGDFAAMARPFTTLFRRKWISVLVKIALWWGSDKLHEKMNDPAAIAPMLEAALRAGESGTGMLGRIRSPTLIVAGTHDQIFDRAALEETAAAIASATLVLVDSETHMLPLEHPSAVAQAIVPFLRPA